MRSTASLIITFGLVSLPVKLYSATESGSSGVCFRQINPETGNRVKQQLVDAKTGQIVSRRDIVKGYEVARDQYVTFTSAEIKELAAESSKSVDVEQFVPVEAIDPMFIDKPHFLAPDKGGEKPYELLRRVLYEEGKAAVGQYAMRGKQYLVAIRATQEGLVLLRLRYASQVRSWDKVPVGTRATVSDAEVKLASQIVAMSSASEIDHSRYVDEVAKRTEELVQARVQGTVFEPESKPAVQPTLDLMAALKASLGVE